jgi:hypothetical protein
LALEVEHVASSELSKCSPTELYNPPSREADWKKITWHLHLTLPRFKSIELRTFRPQFPHPKNGNQKHFSSWSHNSDVAMRIYRTQYLQQFIAHNSSTSFKYYFYYLANNIWINWNDTIIPILQIFLRIMHFNECKVLFFSRRMRHLVLCGPGWPQTSDLECQYPRSWDYRCVSLCLAWQNVFSEMWITIHDVLQLAGRRF